MRSFLRLVLKLKLLVILLTVAIVGLGAYGATELRQQLFPDIEFPFLGIKVEAPGVPPTVLDEQVGQPLAKVAEEQDGVRNLQVVSSDGVVTLYGELELGSDVSETTDEVLAALREVDLPAGVEQPDVLGSFTEQPVLITAITTREGADLEGLTERVNELKADLEEVEGVNRVEVPGAQREQVQVQLKAEALAAGVTPAYVLEALGEDAATKEISALEGIELPDVPAGAGATGLVGANPAAGDVDGGDVTTVGDIASISRTVDPGAGFAIANGEPSIAVRVIREQDANEVAVVDEAQTVIEEFDSANDDLKVVTLSENASGVKASIKGLLIEGVLGALGAVLVIFLFLRSGRGTIIAAVSIPTSLVFGLLAGWALDLTLDIFTLAGLTIAIGRVIDDAIVVIENISKHVERGEDIREAVVEGTAEVATAIMASTAATVAVFLPLGFLGGFISTLFQPFSVIVAVSLVASLLVAITIIPVLAELMFRKAATEHTLHIHENGRLERWVRPATAFGLRRRWVPITIAFVSLLGTGLLVSSGAIPTQFLPDSTVQQLYGTVNLTPGLSEEDAKAELDELTKILDDTEGVVDWQYSFGAETFFNDPSAGPGAVTFVANLDEDAEGDPIVEDVREAGLEVYPEAFAVQQLENGPPAGGFQARVKADDPEKLTKATERMVEYLKDQDTLTEVTGSQGTATIPQLDVELKDGAGDTEVAALRRAVAAYTTTAVDESGDGPSIAVLSPAAGAGPDGPGAGGPLAAAPTEGEAPGGGFDPTTALAALPAVPLSDRTEGSADETRTIGEVADLTIEDQLAFVARTDGKLVATVEGRIESADTAGVTKDLQAGIKKLDKAGELGDVEIDYEGEAAFVEQMFADLFKAIGIAVLLVIVVLILAFRHVFQPLSMLAPVLFSTFGAYLALAITGNALGLPAMIGQLLLIGIVVSNAILLVDAVIKRRRAGATAHQALQEAAVLRVRPVLMTAFATMAALLPLAIGVSGEGGIVSKSLGVVVIGGLALATFGTLVIVPAAYSIIARGKREERRRLAIDGPATDVDPDSSGRPADDREPVGTK